MLDFIESYFGMSPDGGDGSLEFILVWGLIFSLIVGIGFVLAPRTR
jgi:hypothetical protein